MAARALLLILIACALFGGGLFVGWRAGSAGADKLRAQAAQQSLNQITQSVQAQIAARQEVLSAQLQASQQFAGAVQRIDIQVSGLEDQIDEAVFTPVGADDATVVDPVATGEFVRLYDAAARGGEGPTVAPSTDAGGVHD